MRRKRERSAVCIREVDVGQKTSFVKGGSGGEAFVKDGERSNRLFVRGMGRNIYFE